MKWNINRVWWMRRFMLGWVRQREQQGQMKLDGCFSNDAIQTLPLVLRSDKQYRCGIQDGAKTSSTIILGRDITIASKTTGSCLSPCSAPQGLDTWRSESQEV